jgi:hypothetical protein
MSERYAKPIKVLIGQFVENVNVDVVLGKALRVLSETELLKPVSDLLHCAPAKIDPAFPPGGGSLQILSD